MNQNAGEIIRINTADTYSKGKYTTRELDNADKIKLLKPNDQLQLIPKVKP